MFAAIQKFVREEDGLETVEYAVMTALIVAAIITAIGVLVTAVSGRFEDVGGTIDGLPD